MQIEIDFEVFKALTALRQSESDTYNHVLRRLLDLPPTLKLSDLVRGVPFGIGAGARALSDTATEKSKLPEHEISENIASLVVSALGGGGASYDGVWFPEGTLFRANYKGRSYHATIREGQWIGDDGIARTSPSNAAGAISQTNVNGWRFWYAKLPDSNEWRRMDDFKR